ncbi:spermidine synthase [Streptomyces sp. ALI-76-A]|jgi:spermidine synthase|uniref:spermine/spermidine synthase domain-containing protein n=1 Tax=Streptomyces sp. ALI-76-A TaxID=3025736 RepID=UPI00256F6262|nr:spermidine synthase [Streptomyces sp. ALI-76-A]MDL5203776.1 spermidine synthase [Streptomyces sp. ALI-76-A]
MLTPYDTPHTVAHDGAPHDGVAQGVSHDAPQVLDRREGPYGEVVLRRHGALLQIIANGCFLMDTSDGRSERRLIDAALDALDDRAEPSVLIGGLGVGFSLAHAAANPRWGRITVVERETAIIDWHREGPLAALSAEAFADPRTDIVKTDLVAFVNETCDTFDALCLDIDNGPDWTVTEGNDSLYSSAGLTSCARALKPGGVLAVWSARPSPKFEGSLRNAGFRQVRTEEIQVARGVPDVVHLAVRPG